MYSKVLAERVSELKETPKGMKYMCRELEELYSEEFELGKEQGKLKLAKETALSMAEDGVKIEKISHYIKVSPKTSQVWLNTKDN